MSLQREEVPAGPGPNASGVGRTGLDQADKQPADLRERVADHVRVAGADGPFSPGLAGGEPGQCEHEQGDGGIPWPARTVPGTDRARPRPWPAACTPQYASGFPRLRFLV